MIGFMCTTCEWNGWAYAIVPPQILAGYYDDGMDNLHRWNAAAQGVPTVIGFMYTTWENKYDILEDYGKALRGEK